MSANPVHYRTNRADIDFVKDGTWKAVSLTPYLEQEDAGVVILECWNEAAEAKSVGIDNAGTQVESISIRSYGLLHYAALLGATKEVSLRATDSNVHVGIVAELCSPGIAFYDTPVLVQPNGAADIGKWINRSATPIGGDSISDIGSVILIACGNQSTQGDWGARCLGSVSSRLWGRLDTNDLYFIPCATDDGDFQVWFPGKTDPIYECYLWMWMLGYSRVGYPFYGIVDFEDEEPPQAAAWTTRAAGPNVPDGATGIFAASYVMGSSSTQEHGVRAVGSANPSGRVTTLKPFDSACPARLNSSREYQYLADSADPELWILAYTAAQEASWSGQIQFTMQGQGVGVQFAAAAGQIEFTAEGQGCGLVSASGEGTIDFLATGEARVSIPGELIGTPEIESVMSGVPKVESVMTATPEIEDVLTGKPTVSEG